MVGTGRDSIVDFRNAEGDLINLATIDADTGKTGNQTFAEKSRLPNGRDRVPIPLGCVDGFNEDEG